MLTTARRVTLADMQAESPRPTWGPFDCRPDREDVVGEDGTVYAITCQCGGEHPILRFAQHQRVVRSAEAEA